MKARMTSLSQVLRREMTKEERHLWYDFLKTLPQTIHRQKVVGRYIVDFYCAEAKLIIEIDGTQHYEEEGKSKDLERDSYLYSLGYTVVRYSNRDIHENFEGVCTDILNRILESKEDRKPSLNGKPLGVTE